MFFIVDKNTRVVLRTSLTPFNVDESVQPPNGIVQLKGIENNTVPSFDPQTQKLVRSFTDDDATGTRTFRLQAVALSADELAVVAQASQDETERLAIKAVISDLRNGIGTATQRIQRVERACAYLLRQEVRR